MSSAVTFHPDALRRLGAWTPDTLAVQAAGDPHPFVVQDMIFKNTVNISVGDSTIGKTPLLMSMAIAVASGTPWMGRPTNRGNVLFIDGESTLENIHRMIATLSEFAGLSEPPRNLTIFGWNFDYRERPEDIRTTIEKLVKLVKPALVVVDPLRVFFHKAEAEPQEAMEMLRWQQKTGREFHTAWITQHHRRKPDVKKTLNIKEEPREWLLEASGTKALINQTHTRLGIDYEEGMEDQLIVGGLIRDLGPMKAPLRIERVYDTDGDPIAYQPLRGVNHISAEWRNALEGMPTASSYKDVKRALGTKSDSTVQKFIATCTNLQLLRAEGEAGSKKRRYVKLKEAETELAEVREQTAAKRREVHEVLAETMPGDWIDNLPENEKPQKYKDHALTVVELNAEERAA
jgi:hypothetical protein